MDNYVPLLPALISITLILITKEIYSSLFIGIFCGSLLLSNFNILVTFDNIINEGFIKSLSDKDNLGIILFLIILGIISNIINISGGAEAFGQWALKNIDSKRKTLFTTLVLGLLIFIDDYFNCLTVGNIMKPITDRHKISNAKLAYIIDSTAAPVCVISPISSWAAAIIGCISNNNSLDVFIQSILYNYYPIMTLIFIVLMISFDVDYGKMKTFEENNKNINIEENIKLNDNCIKGKIIDLLIPIVLVIFFCFIGLIFTGGFFDNSRNEFHNFTLAIKNTKSSIGLSIGSLISLVITLVYFSIRKTIGFKNLMNCVPEGFKTMVSAILILVFSWSLKNIMFALNINLLFNNILGHYIYSFDYLIPAEIYVLTAIVSFATGSSWITFSIFIPIIVSMLQDYNFQLMIISISAILSGSVLGDHSSPISDTSIMASTATKCKHIVHIETQLYYVLTVGLISLLCFIIAGITKNVFIPFFIGIIILFIVLYFVKYKMSKI